MGDMTVDELKDKKLWFLWSAKPGRNGKVTKVPFAVNGGATGTDDAHKGSWVSFDDAESADFWMKFPEFTENRRKLRRAERFDRSDMQRVFKLCIIIH